jgi:superfamily II DNA or RNA helicase
MVGAQYRLRIIDSCFPSTHFDGIGLEIVSRNGVVKNMNTICQRMSNDLPMKMELSSTVMNIDIPVDNDVKTPAVKVDDIKTPADDTKATSVVDVKTPADDTKTTSVVGTTVDDDGDVTMATDEKTSSHLSNMQVMATLKITKHRQDCKTADLSNVVCMRDIEKHGNTFLLDVAAGAGKTRMALDACANTTDGDALIITKNKRSTKQFMTKWLKIKKHYADDIIVTDDTELKAQEHQKKITIISMFETIKLQQVQSAAIIIVDEGHLMSSQADIAKINKYRLVVVETIVRLYPKQIVLSSATPLHSITDSPRQFTFTTRDAVKENLVCPVDMNVIHVKSREDVIPEIAATIIAGNVPLPATVRCSSTKKAKQMAGLLATCDKIHVMKMWSGEKKTFDHHQVTTNTVIVVVDMANGDLDIPRLKSAVDTIGSDASMVALVQYLLRAGRKHTSKTTGNFYFPCIEANMKRVIRAFALIAHALGYRLEKLLGNITHRVGHTIKKTSKDGDEEEEEYDVTDFDSCVIKVIGDGVKLKDFIDGVIKTDAHAMKTRLTKKERAEMKAAKLATKRERMEAKEKRRQEQLAFIKNWFDDEQNVEKDSVTGKVVRILKMMNYRSTCDMEKRSAQRVLCMVGVHKRNQNDHQNLMASSGYACHVAEFNARRASTFSLTFINAKSELESLTVPLPTTVQEAKKLLSKKTMNYVSGSLVSAINSTHVINNKPYIKDWQQIDDHVQVTDVIDKHDTIRIIYLLATEGTYVKKAVLQALTEEEKETGMSPKGALTYRWFVKHNSEWPKQKQTISIPRYVDGLRAHGRPHDVVVKIGVHVKKLRNQSQGKGKHSDVYANDLKIISDLRGKNELECMY